MATGKKISVHFGRLVEQFRSTNVEEGTLLVAFLQKRKIEFGAAIRVNGRVVTREYALRDGDIVTEINNVGGGSN